MTAGRIAEEKAVVGKMVRIYCKGQGHGGRLCSDCTELLLYAEARLDSCLFGQGKPFCSKCEVHCYRPEMRQKMRAVMRYSGPRMLLYDPVMAIRHLWGSRR